MPPAAMDLLVQLGQPVLIARRKARMTQAELAQAAGVGRVVVSRIETGKPVESWALALVMQALRLRVEGP